MLRCPFDVKSHYGEGFPANTPDDEWLHIVGSKGWIVCSHDQKWRVEQAAMKAIEQHNIRCIYLYGANSLSFFKLKSLAHNYDKIIKVCKEDSGPFILKVTSANRLQRIL